MRGRALRHSESVARAKGQRGWTMGKPIVVSDVDGNIFAVVGACKRALKRAGQREQATELARRVRGAESYDDALAICDEYVEFE